MRRNGDDAPTVTRIQAARLLQRSIVVVRKYERTGRLHSKIDARGFHRYERREVIALAKKIGSLVPADDVTAQQSAKAFRMFQADATLVEVVIQTELRPEQVRELYAQFITPLGRDVPGPPPPLDDYDVRAQALEDEVVRRRKRREGATG